jgi:cytochrome c-type biogenesis protein CcmH
VILFWVICAAMILIALVFVLPPALQRSEESNRETDDERKKANIAVYRDQLSELEADVKNGIVSEEQYAQDREEIERRLLEDIATTNTKKTAAPPVSARNTAYLLGVGLPLVAIIFYLNVGTPKAVDGEPPAMASQSGPAAAPGGRTQEQIQANVDKLAERLKSNPSDVQGWTMLARSYTSMERFGEAAGAYAKATELKPNDADLWTEYAFATAMASGRSLEGKPMELIQQALKVEPENAKALQLAGSAAFQARDYNKAIDYWNRVLKQVPADSEAGRLIVQRIDEARKLAAGNSK